MATVLIGFMGAGKSSAARALAGPEIDTDALVEQRLGKTVAEVFATDGEAAFRAVEEEVVLGALAGAGADAAVSLGGGATESARVRDALSEHTVVWLDVGCDSAWERVSRRPGKRPLASERDAFDALYDERRGTYERLADVTLLEGSDVADADAAWRRASPPRGTRMVWSPAGQYPVFVGRDIISIAAGPREGRSFVITDDIVAELYLARTAAAAGVVEIPAGERHKTLETAGRAWAALAAQNATRADHVVALGGGVVGDLAGFVAHCYQRGIPVVQLPTTVVAMVDSALGGKTGVDLPAAKNYVGAYHQPAAVVADVSTLATLPPEEHAAGFAEVVKTALIAGGELWERVAAGEPLDDAMVLACARTKLAVVAADERDGGLRQVLNLGHTVGHALETATGYSTLRHGEAVALGLLAALTLSGRPELRAEVAELLAGAGLPTELRGVDPDAVVRATRLDKKRTTGDVPFVLVRAPGDVVHGQAVAEADLRAAVAEIIRP